MNSFDPSQGPFPSEYKHTLRPTNLDLVSEALLVNSKPREKIDIEQSEPDRERTKFEDLYDNQYEPFERARTWISDNEYWFQEHVHFRELMDTIRAWNRARGNDDDALVAPPLDLLETGFKHKMAIQKQQVATIIANKAARMRRQEEIAEKAERSEREAQKAASLESAQELKDLRQQLKLSAAECMRLSEELANAKQQLLQEPSKVSKKRPQHQIRPIKTRSKQNLATTRIDALVDRLPSKKKKRVPAPELNRLPGPK